MDADDLQKQARELAGKLRDGAGEQVAKNEKQIKSTLGKLVSFVNEKTGGKYADQVSKAAGYVEQGVDTLAAGHRPADSPDAAGSSASDAPSTPPSGAAPPSPSAPQSGAAPQPPSEPQPPSAPPTGAAPPPPSAPVTPSAPQSGADESSLPPRYEPPGSSTPPPPEEEPPPPPRHQPPTG